MTLLDVNKSLVMLNLFSIVLVFQWRLAVLDLLAKEFLSEHATGCLQVVLDKLFVY